MSDCIFCGINSHEIAAEMIYEDETAAAFLDIHPRAPGHTVVIPKQHAATLGELDVALLGPLFVAVQKIARMVKDRLRADGLTIGINEGAVSGQTVEHFHVHILPRFVNDKGGSLHDVVNNPPRESLVEIAKKIR